MNGIAKIILGIVIGVGLVCAAGFLLLGGLMHAATSAVSDTEPAKVAAAAERIADFDLPEGYQEEYTVDLAGYLLVGYEPGDGHSHLVLAQGPKGMKFDQETLDQYIEQAQPGRKDRTTRVKVVEQRAVTIRGQETTLVIHEGTNSEGQSYRTLTAAFQGKNGPAVVYLEEPTNRWDDSRVETFLNSIQ